MMIMMVAMDKDVVGMVITKDIQKQLKKDGNIVEEEQHAEEAIMKIAEEVADAAGLGIHANMLKLHQEDGAIVTNTKDLKIKKTGKKPVFLFFSYSDLINIKLIYLEPYFP
jgi:hypothetical protein